MSDSKVYFITVNIFSGKIREHSHNTILAFSTDEICVRQRVPRALRKAYTMPDTVLLKR